MYELMLWFADQQLKKHPQYSNVWFFWWQIEVLSRRRSRLFDIFDFTVKHSTRCKTRSAFVERGFTTMFYQYQQDFCQNREELEDQEFTDLCMFSHMLT